MIMDSTEGTTTTTTNARTRQGGGTPPAKPGSNSSSDSSTGTSSGDTSANTGGTGEMPEEFDGQPPEMCDADSEDCEMPEMPEGMQGMGPGGGRFPGEMTGQDASPDSVLHPVGYLALGAGSLVLSMVVVYACFSKLFHKKPGQTFDKGAKFAWYCVASLVLAAGLIALCYFIPIWTA